MSEPSLMEVLESFVGQSDGRTRSSPNWWSGMARSRISRLECESKSSSMK